MTPVQTDRAGMPKVSVVLPFYNRISYTMESIRSVQNQTYPHWELLLIDDGSVEDSSPIQALADEEPRIRLFHQENQGVASARNYGIRQASGEYIAFLDSDDLWAKNKLEEQIAYMQAENCSFSHTSYQRIRADLSELEVVHSGLQRGDIYPEVLSDCAITTSTVVMHRRVLAGRLDPFPSSFHIGEDVCLWIDIAAEYAVGGIDRPFTRFRVGNATAALDPQKQLTGLKNILSYILRSPRYSTEHEQIEAVREMICELEDGKTQREWQKQREKYIENSVLWRLGKPLRLVKKAAVVWKRDGAGAVLKKTQKKVRSLGRRR